MTVLGRRSLFCLLAALVGVSAALAASCGGKSAKPEPGPKRVFRHFHSRPDLAPPAVEVVTPASNTAPGYIFFAPKKKVKQRGPLMVDNDGNVVWFKPLTNHEATDFKVQTYRGKPVLTWWQGKSAFGIGQGVGMIYDSSYRKIAEIHAGHGLQSDLHEFRLTPRGTALITIYHKVTADLSSVGGPKNGFVQDSVAQEVDVASGRVLFEWHSWPQVPLDESYAPPRKVKKHGKTIVVPYDYFHINSVNLNGHGNYLISARNTRSLYDLSPRGKILWRLGGKKSDFKMEPGTTFAWQHDAELHPDGTLTLFDNESMPKVGDHSRALVLRPDFKTHVVRLVHAYAHPDKLLAPHQGNFQLLPNGDAFVGWGGIPYFTEFNREGKVVFDAHFPQNEDSYRAYRFVWHGHPADSPKIAVVPGKAGQVTIYASWNGATEVAKWEVLAGNGRKHLKSVRQAEKLGFETQIAVASGANWFQVRALDAGGKTLGTSKPVKRS